MNPFPRWKASVSFLGPRPEDTQTIHYGLFEASDQSAAAGLVAGWAALYRYPSVGKRGFLNQVDRNKFRASIGWRTRRYPAVLNGCTIIITISEVR